MDLDLKCESKLNLLFGCFALCLGALGKAPSKVTDALPEMPSGATAASDDESEEDIEEMQSRLAALRS